MIGIIDYKMGNLASVQNACQKVGMDSSIIRDPEELVSCERLILPGVGAFGDAMDHLKEYGFVEPIREYAASGKPLLGICLGMQLLFDSSCEFGEHEGLGLVPGRVVKFDKTKLDAGLKIPQMGWNKLFVQRESPLFEDLPKEIYLYFVHSYHVVCEKEEDEIGRTEYGYAFSSAVQRGNVYGFQPHPEKSHEMGLKILKNFTKV